MADHLTKECSQHIFKSVSCCVVLIKGEVQDRLLFASTYRLLIQDVEELLAGLSRVDVPMNI